MKKPSLSAALAQKQPATLPAAEQAPTGKPKDGRITTTLRIEPERLEALKIIAAKNRVKVNDLLLDGAAHILALHGHKM